MKFKVMKLKVAYTPHFVRQFKALEISLQEEVLEKIELFKNKKNHRLLKVHKLTGRLYKRHGFSVNYKVRIVFSYLAKNEVALLAVGSHAIYEK